VLGDPVSHHHSLRTEGTYSRTTRSCARSVIRATRSQFSVAHNGRFRLTQTTLRRIEVAPVPDLSNVATPTKAIITIPITLFGNGYDAEEGGPERRRDGREHREYKRDKARRCSRLVWPLGDRKKDMLQLQRLAHHAHRILVQPVQAGLIAQPWWRTRPQGLCHVSTF
jgi:hypothetical protein